MNAIDHYLSDEIDPLFIRGARDHLLPHLRHGRVLNVGLGYGTWDETLAAGSDQVVGLDFDAGLVEHFRTRYPRIRYVHADVFDYQPEAPFDTIIASHILEHVDDAVALVRRFLGWLVPEGRLLVVVPNADSVHRKIGKQMGFLREVTDLNEGDVKLGHRRVYTRPLLEEHFRAAGARVIHLTGVTFKPLSNAQIASLPRAYVEACIRMTSAETGGLENQLAAVLAR